MAEIGLGDVSLSFGGAPLLDGISVQIHKGERVGLLGRNGCGKSTMLAILAGTIEPDDGQVVRRPGVRVAALAQEVPRDLEGSVGDALREGLSAADIDGEWEVKERVDKVAKLLGLDLAGDVGSLSAGSKRRVLLGQALISQPDVLILDEPTNHLDIEAVEGLEEMLGARGTTLLFVTHDRAFLEALATRILDLDRGKLASYDCDYPTYLVRKEAELLAEEKQNVVFDKKLALEETWLRRGVKARRTRNQGRVRALKTMREDRAGRRDVVGRVQAELHSAGRTGQLVIRTKNVSHSFGTTRIVRDLSLEIQRGDRIGLVGPNGCGKTTLLRLLLGELEPDEGTVKHGTKLHVARFDQLHSVLDPTRTLRENVCDDGDTITVGGRSRHVVGYLRDFLFTTDQIQGSIRHLSGGELNRLQLARILSRPCNLLVLDEPTNDLDLETLELLEELLTEFDGTLILVSHDRTFLDNVVTSTIVFDGDGRVREHVGGFSDWRRETAPVQKKKTSARPALAPAQAAGPKVRKLTYGEELELDKLPDRIDVLEARKAELVARLADPALYAGAATEVAGTTGELNTVSAELEGVIERWAELEELRS